MLRRVGVAAFTLAVIGAIVGISWLFLQYRQAKALADPERVRTLGGPMPVRTARVEQKEVRKVIGATCLTVPSKQSNISSTASSHVGPIGSAGQPTGLVVKKVFVKHGDRVSAGQVLVELIDRDYTSTIVAWDAMLVAGVKEVQYRDKALELNQVIRKINVERAEANGHYRTVDLGTKTKLRDALQALSKTGAASIIAYLDALSKFADAEFALAASKFDLLHAKTEVTLGLLQDQFQLAQAISNREQATVGLDLVKRSQEACRVQSPLNGFVGTVTIVPGEVVGFGAPLMHVDQLDPIWIDMDFPQERIGELAMGQEAEIVLDSYPKETFKGKVVAALPQVNSQLRLLPVYIQVANPDCRIKAGVSGFARLSIAEKAITVPAAAVIEDQHRSMVFCVKEGRAQVRQVITGQVVETGLLEVQSGLSPGDEVVVFGQRYLRDGDVVNTDWHKWARRE